MRLLQIQLNGNDSGVLEFHPMLTVVSGLTPSARARVVQAFTALPRAGDPGCGGLLESHGVLLDLTPHNLALLGLSDVELDVLVRVDDIPAPDVPAGEVPDEAPDEVPADDDRPLADVVPFERPVASPPAEVDAVSPEWVIDTVEPGRYPALDAARTALDSAREALTVFDEATAKARTDHGGALAARIRLEDELDAAVREVERLEAAAAGDDAEADADDEPEAGEPAHAERDREILRARITGLEKRLAQVDRSLSELAAIDVKPIEVLLEAIHNPAPTVMMPSERANELADLIVDLRRQLVVVEARLDAEGFSITKAEERLEAARAEVVAAERAIAKPRLSPEDIAELEAVHEKVLEAESKAAGRLGGRGGRKKLEEALNEQQAILDRVGFPTWSAYVMGAGLLGIDPIAEQRLERARAEVDQAEANWAVITETLENDPEYRGLLDQLEAVYLEAFDLLGGDNSDEDLEVALRHLEVAVQEVTTDDLVAAMAYQFELIGLDLGEAPPLEVITMAAEALLSEAAAISGRIDELTAERRKVRADLSVTEQDLHHLSTPVAPVRAERPAAPRPSVSPEEVDEARRRVDELTEQLAAAREDETDCSDLVDARLALAGAAEGAVVVAERKLREVATEVAGVLALELGVEVVAAAAAGGGADDEPVGRSATGAGALDLGGDEPVDLDAELFGDAPELELVEDPGAPDLDSAPLLSAAGTGGNRFLDILNDLPVGSEPADDELLAEASDVEDEVLAEAEFYLLARLAAQRNLSFAGSVPLLVDDALAALGDDDRLHLLERLERMSAAVQIVYLTDDPVVCSWARAAGPTRAALVEASGG